MKTTTRLIITSIGRRFLRSGFILIALAFVSFALSPLARAVDPPPDGGYPGGNTAEGEDALFSLTLGAGNTAIGFQALYSDLIGGGNTATGREALYNNMTGNANTAIGDVALHNNTTGNNNTAIGSIALFWHTTGSNNTATGFRALEHNNGSGNTATGVRALWTNTTGINNTAGGYQALYNNTAGDNNTANGIQALYSNIDGINNTASGLNALFDNASGSENTATGHSALQSNTTGNDNTADGHDALFNNTTGSNNIAIGHGAGSNLTTGDNNIDIGFFGVAGEANTIRIGTQGTQTATFIAGISGTAIGGGGAVRINSNGQLGTAPSSQRFKEEIEPMNKASEAILALRPVTFRYKKSLDPEGIPQFGLVAEEVEKVAPNLILRDANGKPYTVRYEAVNAMLLNEFLKEHKTVQELKNEIAALTATVKEQAAQIQKVSAQIQASRSAPQVALSNP
jgi:hypothetical protein